MPGHLRRNAVAYAALLAALALGLDAPAHAAAAVANGSITTAKLANGAVTSAKIADGTVTGRDVRDRSLGAKDLAVGVVPADQFLWETGTFSEDPAITPDRTPEEVTKTFTLPRAGVAHVRMFGARLGSDCSLGGTPKGGVYIDGLRLAGAGTRIESYADAGPVELVGATYLSKGPHTLEYGIYCTSGVPTSYSFGGITWAVTLPAQ